MSDHSDFDALADVERIARRIVDVHLAPLVKRLSPYGEDRADFMAVHNAVGSCVSLMTCVSLLQGEREKAAADLAAARAEREELAMVCDAYGLPHSAVGLDRHLTGNAALTIEVWKEAARLAGEQRDAARAQLAAVEAVVADLEARRDDHSERLSDFEDGYSVAMSDAASELRAALDQPGQAAARIKADAWDESVETMMEWNAAYRHGDNGPPDPPTNPYRSTT